METVKLYDIDPYEYTFQGKVVSCEAKDGKFFVVLDKTAFFPEEGGQDADKGVISATGVSTEIPVLDVYLKDGIITHVLDRAIEAGLSVTGTVDFKRRFDYMQQHTGEHMLCGVAHSLFGCENVGFHLREHLVTMDLDKPLSKEDLRLIERKANEYIYENRAVNCFYPDASTLSDIPYRSKSEILGPVRIVEIEGVDSCACCAPHVKTTGEVGMIKIVAFESHRGGMRLEIKCGLRALEDYSAKQDCLWETGAALSVPQERITEALERVKADGAKQNSMRILMQQKYMNLLIDGLSPQDENAFVFAEGIDMTAARECVNSLMETHAGFSGAFVGNDEDGYSFVIGSLKENCREFAGTMREKLGASCGGSERMIQGSVKGTALEIQGVL